MVEEGLATEVSKIRDHQNKLLVRFEPTRGKTNNVVFEQVQHKPTCTATEAG